MLKNSFILLFAAIIIAGLALPTVASGPAMLPDDQPPELDPQTLEPMRENTVQEDTVQEDANSLPGHITDPLKLTNVQILVNPDNSLPSNFVPADLTAIKSFISTNGDVRLRADAAQALKEMLAALKAAGIKDIYANSGYRSFMKQRELHRNKVAYYLGLGSNEAKARAQAARWVLPPGESEHQTGLAVDLSTSGIGFELVEAFAKTPAGRWLNEHCVEYGFILRYTAEKEPFTGVASEPWHFRYVGADHAFYMRQLGLCLEEYHALLRKENQILFENALGERRSVHFSIGDNSAALPGTPLTISLASYGSEGRIITMQPPPPEPLFDALGHWAEPYIMRLRGLGVVGGYTDGSFRPNTGVSRGEFVTAFSRLPLALFTDAQAPPIEEDVPVPEWMLFPFVLPYDDVDAGKFYYQPLLMCYRASLVQVLEIKSEGALLFEANRPLARFEAAQMLAKALNSDNFRLPANPSYSDVPKTTGQLYRAVEFLTARGILSGSGEGLFSPDRGISRAEMSAMLCRLLDVMMQEASIKAAESAAAENDKTPTTPITPVTEAIENKITEEADNKLSEADDNKIRE